MGVKIILVFLGTDYNLEVPEGTTVASAIQRARDFYNLGIPPIYACKINKVAATAQTILANGDKLSVSVSRS